MAYDVDKWTDKELNRLEKRIKEQYAIAGAELGEKADNFLAQYKPIMQKEYKAMEAKTHGYAGLTDRQALEKFKAWQYSYLSRAEGWKDAKDTMVARMVKSDTIIADYVNNALPNIYVRNNNAVATIAQNYAKENGVTGVRFDLIDEYTVKRLMAGSREVRPYKPIEINTKKLTNYNAGKMQNALLQGILQGESIPQMAKRFEALGMSTGWATAMTRTAVTGARSAGKQDRYDDLASQGVVFTKIWVATNDDRTREEHNEADGQEVDYSEPFDVGGEELMYPGDPNGSDWNIINCRCTVKTGKPTFKSILSNDTRQFSNISIKGEDEAVNTSVTEDTPKSKIREKLENSNIKYNEVSYYTEQPTKDEIIAKISGGDKTGGSCMSLSWAYMGNINGVDVTDFRGGDSQEFFSRKANIKDMLEMVGAKYTSTNEYNDFKAGMQLLKSMEQDKEYCLVVGSHASMVRNTLNGYEYLELQCEGIGTQIVKSSWGEYEKAGSGWTAFNGNPRYTLKQRFGCKEKTTCGGVKFKKDSFLIDPDSFKDNKEFDKILGYINTETGSQKKGASGYAK